MTRTGHASALQKVQLTLHKNYHVKDPRVVLPSHQAHGLRLKRDICHKNHAEGCEESHASFSINSNPDG
jgi:hypothetical protein